jgi:hypothetical protein
MIYATRMVAKRMESSTEAKTYHRAANEHSKRQQVIHIRRSVASGDQLVYIERIAEEHQRADEMRVNVPRLIMQVEQAPQRFSVRSRNSAIHATYVFVVALPSLDILEGEQDPF